MTVEILQSEISTAGVNAHQERNHRACGDAWAVLLVQTGLSSQAGTGPEVPISFPFRIAHQVSSLTSTCMLVQLCGITSESAAAAAAFPLCLSLFVA